MRMRALYGGRAGRLERRQQRGGLSPGSCDAGPAGRAVGQRDDLTERQERRVASLIGEAAHEL
jgi:hypothetical protein